MSAADFLLLLVAGGGAIALWLVVRFPELAPRTLRGALVHLGIGSLIVTTATPLLGLAVSVVGPVGATIGVALPAVVYLFLSGAWFFSAAQREGAWPTL